MPGPIDYTRKQNFISPGLWPWTVRWYLLKRDIAISIKQARPLLAGIVLDVGCGSKPYKDLLIATEYVGIDVSTSLHNVSHAEKIFDGINIPFGDECFDSVLCTEVLEHCLNPGKLMDEIKRVLRKGGNALITVPMVIEHHEMPLDMRRYTYFGLKNLAEKRGLRIDSIQPRGGVIGVTVYMIYLMIEQMISRRPFVDIVYYILFPFTYLLLKLDKYILRKPPVISLGWQMLISKSLDE